MRAIARDPFARQSLVRAVVRPLAPGQTCSWCGNVRISRRSRTTSLYRYGTEPDAIQPTSVVAPWRVLRQVLS
jgi:hypothetical protein